MKRNIPFDEAITNCGATFLRYDSTPLMCYRAAKNFVDEYEREEREQRRAVPDPAQRALPPDWSDDKQKAYHQLASALFEGGDFVKMQAVAKSFVEICKREEPNVGDIYRDVFGQSVVVTEIGSMNYGTRKNVIFYNKEDQRKLPMEEFMRCFQKV